MKLALPLLAIGVAACGNSGSLDPVPPRPVMSQMPARQYVGRFTIDVDPANGTATVRQDGVATSGRGIHVPAIVVQNNNPLSNPPGTFQLVTTNPIVGDGMNGCAATDNCFTVSVDSFLTRAATEVTLVVDGASPTRTMSNGDAAPPGSGLASALGIRTFGDIAAGASSVRDINFTIPSTDPYTVQLSLWEQQLPSNSVTFVTDTQGAGSLACTAFDGWRAGLDGGTVYNSISISADGTTYACNGAQADTLCQALRTGATVIETCGGAEFLVNDCAASGTWLEVSPIDPGVQCRCAVAAAARPCFPAVGQTEVSGVYAVPTDTCSDVIVQSITVTCAP